MSPEPKIERYEVVTPVSFTGDDYGNLVVQTGSGELRVNKKHENLHQLFMNAADNGSAVKVGYGVYMNKEYVHTAEYSDGSNPPPKPAPERALPAPTKESTNASIETQVAFKGIIELIVAGKSTEQATQAAMNWAMSKLANWSSTGEAPKKTEPIVTKKEIAGAKAKNDLILELGEVIRKTGYAPEEVKDFASTKYGKGKSTDLTEKELKELIQEVKNFQIT